MSRMPGFICELQADGRGAGSSHRRGAGPFRVSRTAYMGILICCLTILVLVGAGSVRAAEEPKIGQSDSVWMPGGTLLYLDAAGDGAAEYTLFLNWDTPTVAMRIGLPWNLSMGMYMSMPRRILGTFGAAGFDEAVHGERYDGTGLFLNVDVGYSLDWLYGITVVPTVGYFAGAGVVYSRQEVGLPSGWFAVKAQRFGLTLEENLALGVAVRVSLGYLPEVSGYLGSGDYAVTGNGYDFTVAGEYNLAPGLTFSIGYRTVAAGEPSQFIADQFGGGGVFFGGTYRF